MCGGEVGDETLAGPPDLLDRQHHSRLGVVVVVADRHGPGDLDGVVGTLGEVVDG